MKKGIASGILASFLINLMLSVGLRSHAATVGVAFFSLNPNPVRIKVGETVYWDEDDVDFGPYVISGPWGAFYTPGGVQFQTSGTFNYTAQSIFGGSWPGQVIVSANSIPTVTIVTPTNNSVLAAPATFAFEAEAFDADADDVWDVEFWVGSVLVDDVYSPPYATTVTNLAAGTYTLKAIVWDYSYAKATNSVTITVGNIQPITLHATRISAGKFEFKADGLTAGQNFVLQSSTNPVSATSWLPVSTNVATETTASFTNTVAAGSRFFRILKLP